MDEELNFRDSPALKNGIPRRIDLEELSSSMMVGWDSSSLSPRASSLAGTSPRTVGEVSMQISHGGVDQSGGENIKGSDSGDETMENGNRKEAWTPFLRSRMWNASDGPTRSLERH